MEKREVNIDYFVCQNSFPEGYESLCRAAIEASRKAYCVYSGFAVGAALLLDDGTVITGSNQENAAYPSGMCAERTALFHAGAQHPGRSVKALAIAACRDGIPREEPVAPCGACRQVMAETIKRHRRDFDLILIGNRESLLVKASALLPFTFTLPDTKNA